MRRPPGPVYRLADWTPELGVDEQEWAAALAAEGWLPWPDAQVTPAQVDVGGRVVSRWYLRRTQDTSRSGTP